MSGHQKSVDGSQFIGATALYFSTNMQYDNEVIKDANNHIVEIRVSGIGGREINEDTNRYEQSFNQPHSFNLPMLFSAEHQLPVRVFFAEADNKIIYLGLWVVKGCEYKEWHDGSCMYWIFTLKKAIAK